jgi:antitoxin (DNA-binding transcriptional repressor) of toxin-antitoxin stability system
MARRSLFCVLTSIAVAAIASASIAGVISAKRGVVEKISPDGKTVTVKFARAEETTELSVAGEIDVLMDGKHVALTAIKPGMSVTVQVDGTVAQRIIAHAASDAEPKTPKAAKSPKPKSTTKVSTTRKSKQTARKPSKSGSKKNEPNALDELPFATTPLAGLQGAPSGNKNQPSALDSLPTAVTPLGGAKAPSSGKQNGPSALDALPVATTPLAGAKSP